MGSGHSQRRGLPALGAKETTIRVVDVPPDALFGQYPGSDQGKHARRARSSLSQLYATNDLVRCEPDVGEDSPGVWRPSG